MWRLMMIGLIALAATLLGCDSDCPIGCPNPSIGMVLIPSNLAAPLVSVTSTAACEVNYQRDPTGMMPGFVSVLLNDVSETDSVTCQVHGMLADGSQVQAAITYKYHFFSGCCAGPAFVSVDTPTFAPAS